jgi:hypothetical protein
VFKKTNHYFSLIYWRVSFLGESKKETHPSCAGRIGATTFPEVLHLPAPLALSARKLAQVFLFIFFIIHVAPAPISAAMSAAAAAAPTKAATTKAAARPSGRPRRALANDSHIYGGHRKKEQLVETQKGAAETNGCGNEHTLQCPSPSSKHLHCTHKNFRKHPINKKKGRKHQFFLQVKQQKKTSQAKKTTVLFQLRAEKKPRFSSSAKFSIISKLPLWPSVPLPLHTHPAQDDCAPLSQSGSGPLWKFGFCLQFLLFVSFDSGHQQPKPYVWNRHYIVLLRYSSLKFADSGFAGVAFTGAASVTVCAAAGRFFTPLFGAGGVFSSKMRLGNSVSLCSPSAKVANVAKTKPEDPLLKL